MWAWCLWYAAQNNPLRWIHVNRAGYATVVDFSSNSLSYLSLYSGDLDQLPLPTANLVVFDGVTNTSQQLFQKFGVCWYADDRESRRFIAVSSVQFGWAIEEYILYNVEVFKTTGWAIEEYKNACLDNSFYTSIKANLDTDANSNTVDEQIESKYFIAGACVRWMFFVNTQNALLDINNYLKKVTSIDDLIKGLVGERSRESVNHLFTTTDGNNSLFVSQYIVRQLSKFATLSFIQQATLISSSSSNNGSFDGWIFQMDFLANIEHAKKFNQSLSFKNTNEVWYVGASFEYYQASELQKYAGKLVDNCWLIPTKVNQGCFDALQIHPSSKMLRVVQLTVAATHTMKLQYVIEVLQALRTINYTISSLDVVIIVPAGNAANFRLGTVYSDNNIEITQLNWKKSQVRVLEFSRARMFS
jgi:hypothetical protein